MGSNDLFSEQSSLFSVGDHILDPIFLSISLTKVVPINLSYIHKAHSLLLFDLFLLLYSSSLDFDLFFDFFTCEKFALFFNHLIPLRLCQIVDASSCFKSCLDLFSFSITWLDLFSSFRLSRHNTACIQWSGHILLFVLKSWLFLLCYIVAFLQSWVTGHRLGLNWADLSIVDGPIVINLLLLGLLVHLLLLRLRWLIHLLRLNDWSSLHYWLLQRCMLWLRDQRRL